MKINHSQSYKRLEKLKTAPIVILAIVLGVIFVIDIIVIHFYMVPRFINAISADIDAEHVIYVIDMTFDKITIWLGIWGVIALILNILIIYIVWNIQKTIHQQSGLGTN